METNYDLVIIGGGLVGLSLAAALIDTRLTMLVVDARPKPKPIAEPKQSADNSVEGSSMSSGIAPRVSAISRTSAEFLAKVGAWQEIQDGSLSPYAAMHVWDGSGTSHIEFGEPGGSGAPLGHIIENREIELALTKVLDAQANVAVEWNGSLHALDLTESGYKVELADGRMTCCKLLVGADGGQSKVRELCAIRTLGWPYGQTALVTTVQTEMAHQQIARQCFTKKGPLAFLPLRDQHLCSIVWSVEEAEPLLELTDQEFCISLENAFEGRLGHVLAVDQRFSFPLAQQHARHYVGRHMALIGDAAHTIHPLAGQGVNLGFADARCLAQVLKDARLEGKLPGDLSMLKRYQRKRQVDNVAMATAMEAFKRIYNTDNLAINWVRNTGMKIVNDNATVKAILARLAGT